MNSRYTNSYEDKGDYCVIHCYNKDNNFVGDILFDTDDYPMIHKYKWHVEKSRTNLDYAVCTQLGYTLRMHRLLFPNSLQVDHINHNGLDNRRINLRPCTNRENNCNKKFSLNRGIRHHKNGRYYVRIMVNKKEVHLGAYDTIEEARDARAIAETKYFGEFKYQDNEAGNNVL